MRVLVLAPVGRDTELLCSLLRNRNVECVAAQDADELIDLLIDGGGTVLLTEEVIHATRDFRAIVAQISREPEWSDLPVIALVSAGAALKLFPPLEQELEAINLSLIERPARSETILRAVKSGLRARRRQYQVRDFVADRLRTEENLWRTQKLESIGLLAGGVAHDFNNLLTGILGNASMLSYTLPEGSDEAAYNAEILRSAERSADLTRQLLAYSGKGKLITEPINIPSLIKETAQLIRASIPARVSICFDFDELSPLVLGDKTQLQQVVMNLMLNAGEAIPEGKAGTIFTTVRVRELNANDAQRSYDQTLAPGTYVALTVSDDGAGMTPETIARVFDPFFTTKFMGRGLGLAAVSGIARGHGGSIRLESQLGEGTTFTVLLPGNYSVSVADTAFKPQTPLVAGLGHILLVDDENAVRAVAAAILTKLGYQVSLAEHGQGALNTLAKSSSQNPVNLIILDWMMPTMDGQAMLRHLRRDYPALPVIVSTGFSEENARASFSDFTGVWFLQKPFTSAQLSMIVAQAIQKLTKTAES